jgi:hypothetical protein
METKAQETCLGEMVSPTMDDSRSSRQANEGAGHEEPEEGEEYITGTKLTLILISMTLGQFVMMLDQSIISTV